MIVRNPWPTRAECLAGLREGSGGGVKVAVLDTGVDVTHPAFVDCRFGKVYETHWTERGPVTVEGLSADTAGHGTAIAGIVHRLAPAAELLCIRVLDGGSRQYRHELIREGARFARERGATIFNCSFGVPGTGYTLPIYKEWTDAIFHRGATVVAAASNESQDLPEWPAHLAQVIGVVAADCCVENLRKRPGGPIPFAAAGVGVTVPVPGGSYAKVTGSSFATACVSGLLARLVSAFPGISPGMTREALDHFAMEEPSQ